MKKSRKVGAEGTLAALDKRVWPWPPAFPFHRLPTLAVLTQLPAATNGDMCHIKSTCIHGGDRGSASSSLAFFRLNGRSETRVICGT